MALNVEPFYERESYTIRITNAEWKEILLNERDKIIIGGLTRKLGSRSLGCGVREVYLIPYNKTPVGYNVVK